MERLDGTDVYYNIDKTTNNYMNPFTKMQSKGAANYFNVLSDPPSIKERARAQTNQTNLSNPYEGGN